MDTDDNFEECRGDRDDPAAVNRPIGVGGGAGGAAGGRRAGRVKVIKMGGSVAAPTPPPPSTGGTHEPNDSPYGDNFFRHYGVNPRCRNDNSRAKNTW